MLSENERECPHCGRDLTYERNGHTYSKAYLVEIRGVYDGGLLYRDVEGCGMAWHRFPEDDAYYARLHNLAEEYIEKINTQVQALTEDGYPYRYPPSFIRERVDPK